MIGGDEARRDECRDLALDGRHGGRTAARLDAEDEGAAELLALVRQDLPGERGRQREERRQRVDVVLHDLRIKRGKPDELHVDPQSRWHGAGAQAGEALLCVRSRTRRGSPGPRGTRTACATTGAIMISSGRSGERHATLGDGDAVLGEEEAVDAGDGKGLAREPDPRRPAGVSGAPVTLERRRHVPHAGKPGDPGGEAGVVVGVGGAACCRRTR